MTRRRGAVGFMQGMDKNDQDHFRTALLASRLILRVVAVVVTVLLTWVWFTVDDSNARVMLLGAVVFATGSALMVGNTYRLKDIRQRQLAGASDNPARMREVRAALTPEQTVSLRMWLACGGMALGAMGVLLAIIINDVDDVAESIVVAFLILATSLACAYAGTLLRALD